MQYRQCVNMCWLQQDDTNTSTETTMSSASASADQSKTTWAVAQIFSDSSEDSDRSRWTVSFDSNADFIPENHSLRKLIGGKGRLQDLQLSPNAPTFVPTSARDTTTTTITEDNTPTTPNTTATTTTPPNDKNNLDHNNKNNFEDNDNNNKTKTTRRQKIKLLHKMRQEKLRRRRQKHQPSPSTISKHTPAINNPTTPPMQPATITESTTELWSEPTQPPTPTPSTIDMDSISLQLCLTNQRMDPVTLGADRKKSRETSRGPLIHRLSSRSRRQ